MTVALECAEKIGDGVRLIEPLRETLGDVDDLNRPAGLVFDARHLDARNTAWGDRVEG